MELAMEFRSKLQEERNEFNVANESFPRNLVY